MSRSKLWRVGRWDVVFYNPCLYQTTDGAREERCYRDDSAKRYRTTPHQLTYKVKSTDKFKYRPMDPNGRGKNKGQSDGNITEVENNHPSEVRWNFVKKFENKCELRLFVGKQVIDLGWNICFISRKNSSTFPWADCSFCDKPSPPSFPATVPRIHIGRL